MKLLHDSILNNNSNALPRAGQPLAETNGQNHNHLVTNSSSYLFNNEPSTLADVTGQQQSPASISAALNGLATLEHCISRDTEQ